jgi:DNA modification methylase
MNIIYNDDCFNIFSKIKKKSVDLILVDLPYGQTDCKWDVLIDLDKMWNEFKKICKSQCIYIFFCTTKFGISLINSKPKWYKYDIVWEKTCSVGFLNANKQPLRHHEMIYIFGNPCNRSNVKIKKTYNPQKTIGKPYKSNSRDINTTNIYRPTISIPIDNKGDRFPTSVIKFGYDKEKLHPTQKPVGLCEWLIKTYSNEEELVLDFTMGSGSTIIACKNTKRNYIGIEMNKEIFEIAKKRIDEHKIIIPS